MVVARRDRTKFTNASDEESEDYYDESEYVNDEFRSEESSTEDKNVK